MPHGRTIDIRNFMLLSDYTAVREKVVKVKFDEREALRQF